MARDRVITNILFGTITAMGADLGKGVQFLVFLMILDYASGVMLGLSTKTLNSQTGFTGIAKKMMIFFIVLAMDLIDKSLGLSCIKDAAVCFYIANEGLSVIENAAKLGIPIPSAITKFLEQIKQKEDESGLQQRGNDTTSAGKRS